MYYIYTNSPFIFTQGLSHIFPITFLLWAVDLSMSTQLLRCLPKLPNILQQLCSLNNSFGQLGPQLKVHICLTFLIFGMLCQSNLVLRSAGTIDPSRNTWRVSSWPHLAFSSSSGGPRILVCNAWADPPSCPYQQNQATWLRSSGHISGVSGSTTTSSPSHKVATPHLSWFSC